jgi:hypothetical protein
VNLSKTGMKVLALEDASTSQNPSSSNGKFYFVHSKYPICKVITIVIKYSLYPIFFIFSIIVCVSLYETYTYIVNLRLVFSWIINFWNVRFYSNKLIYINYYAVQTFGSYKDAEAFQIDFDNIKKFCSSEIIGM